MQTETLTRTESAAFETLSLSSDLLNRTLSRIDEISASQSLDIAELTMDVSRFVEVTTLLSRVIVVKSRELLVHVKNSHVHLLFVMKGINQAHQKHDLHALEDLIKHELKDNLTRWKIDLIPQIKKVLS